MKIAGFVGIVTLIAVPCFAQNERFYLEGAGGFNVSTIGQSAGNSLTSGNFAAQGGVDVPHVKLFGELGHFNDLHPAGTLDTLDQTVASFASDDGLAVAARAKTPAVYGLGGVRWEPLTAMRVEPYVMGGLGVAHLQPKGVFTYTSGAIPNTDPSMTLSPGQDVTSDLVSAGVYTQPDAQSAFMYSVGGGAELNIAKRWAADVAYRYSRIDSDTPLNNQGMTFGLGYRF